MLLLRSPQSLPTGDLVRSPLDPRSWWRTPWRRTDPVAHETWSWSHRELLTAVDPDPAGPATACGGPDLIVVPAGYSLAVPRRGVLLAAELARTVGCPLVVLCSKDAATRESLEALDGLLRTAEVPDALVLTVGPQPSRLTAFAVDELWVASAWRRGGGRTAGPRLRVTCDVGRKRNIALALGVAMGAQTLLFLDDDIFVSTDGDGAVAPHPRTLTPARLQAAVAAVRHGPLGAVGWTARDFDDNSVLHRIRSEMNCPQNQFIGGGALLVGLTPGTPFFPAIYNEDWIFLLGLLARSEQTRALGEAGDVHQQRFAPYAPRRAMAEELGDLLGEGLLTQLTSRGADLAAAGDADFWMQAFEVRCELRETLQAQVRAGSHPERAEMLLALEAMASVQKQVALDGHVHVKELAEFTRTWRQDLERWEARLSALDGRGVDQVLALGEVRSALIRGVGLRAEVGARRH